MEPFVDSAGRAWEVIDFRADVLRGKKRRLPLGHFEADGRAFVPVDRDGDVMLFEFGKVAYRDLAPCRLAEQLRLAKPSTAKAAERMQPNRRDP